ncbi:thioesterase family protein [Psychrobium sp. 1_MG-2023]|uniref:thioesterase family protein n=1 Tax=Psychrobium sp. 1_MG-2023 TaxID=3062624 RepID=UPI000C33A85F|nr:thioesterase family protein [Psychrobium sp. 1_MG-2023]MDP2561205.1 thioesterase family protein [Psychrobium sp. 1_MG-2023]PKF55290.1 thioesterase [Alteromonadales bacterium alter-6D02]
MNLYLRLLYLLLWKIPRHRAKQSIFDTSHYDFRVLPLDVDINMHLTNSRYLALMDLARTWMMCESGLFKALLKRKWLPVVSSTELTFIKDIKPWQKCTVETKIIAWDDKYFYMEQRFVSNGILHAVANLKGLFVCKGKTIPTSQLLEVAGEQRDAPPLPEAIKHWQALLEAKKHQESNK